MLKQILKYCFFLSLSILNSLSVFTQNLILNPSLETYTQCPVGFTNLNLVSNWNQPTSGSTDYFHQCALSNLVSIPTNFFGNQNARTGNAYAGIRVYQARGSNYKEYIEASLSSPLAANTCYRIRCYISLADAAQYAISNLGFYFSKTSLNLATDSIINFLPQVRNSSSRIVNDVNNWSLIEGLYVAKGGEKNVTFGSFTPNRNCNVSEVNALADTNFFAYYYVDDFELINVRTATQLVLKTSSDTSICDYAFDKVELSIDYPSPTASINWSTGETGNSIIVDSAGEYKVEVVDQCAYGEQTIRVKKVACAPCKTFIANAFTPNGDGINDEFGLLGNCQFTTYNLQIFDRWGRLLFESNQLKKRWNGKIPNSEQVPAGVYGYVFRYRNANENVLERGTVLLIR
jgi:gliding motility-associated-like protein